jgi:DNA mismatch repair ATPase MutL
MISNIHTFTPSKKIKRPSYSTVATWVKESWDEVDEDLVRKSFKSCGISTNTDGSEDDCIFNYDGLVDNLDDEEVENSNSQNNDEKEYPEEINYENKWDVTTNQEGNEDETENDNENDESETENEDNEDNDEKEKEKSKKEDDDDDYEDSDDEEVLHILKELKKKYRVTFFYKILDLLSKMLII